jgi:hypothetical protein
MTNDAMNGDPRSARFSGALVLHWALVIASLVIPSPSSGQTSTNSFPTSLAELTRPAKKIPFSTVIHATTGHRVLELETNNPAHADLRLRILKAARMAGERAQREGLVAARPNEAGNYLEPFVRAALKECGLEARIPHTTNDRAGYPDIEITAPVPCYLELKTYNASTVNTTQRSFYYSPSATPKVTHDAVHLLLGYELEKIERGAKAVFVPTHWKLVSLATLEVDLKFEFNQSNRGLYGDKSATLNEGVIAPARD